MEQPASQSINQYNLRDKAVNPSKLLQITPQINVHFKVFPILKLYITVFRNASYIFVSLLVFCIRAYCLSNISGSMFLQHIGSEKDRIV